MAQQAGTAPHGATQSGATQNGIAPCPAAELDSGARIEDEMCKSVVAVLLYQRRFARASRPALDTLAALYEAFTVSAWRRLAAVASGASSATAAPAIAPLAAEGAAPLLLADCGALCGPLAEVLEYARAMPALQAPSILEDRRIVPEAAAPRQGGLLRADGLPLAALIIPSPNVCLEDLLPTVQERPPPHDT